MARMILSENLRDLLLEQLNHEQYNSQLYMYIAGYLQNKGLDKLGSKFIGQWQEEIGHSKQIYDFLVDMNCPITLESVDGVELPINSISDIADLYLKREIITTDSLNEIKKVCIDESYGVAEEFLRKMVDQQRNELEEALTFSDNCELTENDWKYVKIWNDSLE